MSLAWSLQLGRPHKQSATPLWSNPNNNPGPQDSAKLPFLVILHVHCHTSMPRDFNVHVTPLGMDNWKLIPGLSKNSSCHPFSVVNFSLDPFTVTSPNHDYNSLLISVSPSSDSLNLTLGPGSLKRTPEHRNYCLIKVYNFVNGAVSFNISVLSKSCWIKSETPLQWKLLLFLLIFILPCPHNTHTELWMYYVFNEEQMEMTWNLRPDWGKLSYNWSWLAGHRWVLLSILGFPDGSVVKNTPANEGEAGDMGSILGSGKIPWRREKQPALVFLPGEGNSGNKQLLKSQPWSRCRASSRKATTSSMDFCFTTRILVDSLTLVKSLSLRINKTGWLRQILSFSSHPELAYFLGLSVLLLWKRIKKF